MRIYPYYILNSNDAEHYPPHNVVMDDQQNRYAKKGLKSKLHVMDINTGEEKFPCTVIGLGYMNFTDQADLDENGWDRIKKRMIDVGIH
jgi:hypothetical protein